MEEYKFDLQLFSEEDGGTTAGESTPDNTTVDSTADSTSDDKVKIILDDKGNVRMVPEGNEPEDDDEPDDEPEEDETPKADPEKRKDTPEKEQVQQYTTDELRTTAFESIDPKRLPPEMQSWYKAMQAPITKKNQELAEHIKSLKEIVEKSKQPPAPPVPQITQREFYEKLNTYARTEVAKRFNIEPADLPDSTTDWPDTLRLAYNDVQADVRQRAARQQQQKQQAATKQQTFKESAAAIETELRAADSEAYEYIEEKLRNEELSLKDTRAIQEAVTKGDSTAIKKLFETYRTEFRAQKNGIKTGEQSKTPPKVESAGGGKTQSESRKAPNYSELRNLKNSDSIGAWLARNGINP